MFQLRSVAVRGGTESERVAVRDAVARAAAGRSLLALSPARVAGEIEQVPTIRLASVDRDFPHTLRIRIVPERAVALAVGRGRLSQPAWPRAAAWCVSSSGKTAVPVLPRIWTKRERPSAGRRDPRRCPRRPRSTRSRRARPTSAPSVANVKMEPERGIVMRLRGGLDIVLGPPLQLRRQAAGGRLGAAPLSDDAPIVRSSGVRRRLGAGAARGHAAWRICATPRGSASSTNDATRMAPKPLRMAHDARRTCA